MKTADQRREERRLGILQAAKEIFAERGFHAASINEVIKKAGIARGTFYLYFSSKDAVFESILDLAILELEDRIIGVDMSHGAPPPAMQLHENVSRVLKYMLADKALIQIILNHGLPPDTKLSHRVDDFFRHVEERIQTSLTYGMSVGIVRKCNAAFTAAQILGAVQGGIRQLTKVQDDIDVTPIASELIDFALRGVLAGSAKPLT